MSGQHSALSMCCATQLGEWTQTVPVCATFEGQLVAKHGPSHTAILAGTGVPLNMALDVNSVVTEEEMVNPFTQLRGKA